MSHGSATESYEERLLIGGVADSVLQLSVTRSDHLTTGPSGDLYVLDPVGARIFVIDTAGRLKATMGSRGHGPGEMIDPAAIAADSRGKIYINDYGTGAIQVWDSAGVFQDEIRPQSPPLGGLGAGRNGEIYHETYVVKDGVMQKALIRDSAGGSHIVTSMDRSPRHKADFPTCGGLNLTVAPLLTPELVWAARDSIVAFSRGLQFVVRILVNAKRVAVIQREGRPARVTPDGAMEAAKRKQIQVGTCIVPPEELVRGMGYSEKYPTVERLAVDPTGRIWVRWGPRAGEVSGETAVYSLSGKKLAVVEEHLPFPDAFLPGTSGFWSLSLDSVDVPQLHLFVSSVNTSGN